MKTTLKDDYLVIETLTSNDRKHLKELSDSLFIHKIKFGSLSVHNKISQISIPLIKVIEEN